MDLILGRGSATAVDMMSKKVMLTDTKEAFIGVNENPIFGEGSKSIHKYLRCSSGLVLATRGSSMYTTSEQTSEWHSSSWKEFCINPNEMVIAVLWTSAGATGIWWYVHTMLNFEKMVPPYRDDENRG